MRIQKKPEDRSGDVAIASGMNAVPSRKCQLLEALTRGETAQLS
jgi:hypothetical protein